MYKADACRALELYKIHKRTVKIALNLSDWKTDDGELYFWPKVIASFLSSGDAITRRHTVEMSEQYRDQLAKAIYGRLFGYLVNSANDYLQGQDDSLG